MKLFLIHVGFYDPEIMEGLYEQHSNYFVVAQNITEAKTKARLNLTYKAKKMHIDGIQELNVVDGFPCISAGVLIVFAVKSAKILTSPVITPPSILNLEAVISPSAVK